MEINIFTCTVVLPEEREAMNISFEAMGNPPGKLAACSLPDFLLGLSFASLRNALEGIKGNGGGGR